jgi:hypothetical protein
VVWAKARDTALGFYLRLGWVVVGEGFVYNGLPHHTAVLDLARGCGRTPAPDDRGDGVVAGTTTVPATPGDRPARG